MHSYQHAKSSVVKFGGSVEDYLPIHQWFDASKEHHGDVRHRALRHHTHGIFEAERIFGTTIKNSAGKEVPVRLIGEQHVREDCLGRIPTLSMWLGEIKLKRWMMQGRKSGIPREDANVEMVSMVRAPGMVVSNDVHGCRRKRQHHPTA